MVNNHAESGKRRAASPDERQALHAYHASETKAKSKEFPLSVEAKGGHEPGRPALRAKSPPVKQPAMALRWILNIKASAASRASAPVVKIGLRPYFFKAALGSLINAADDGKIFGHGKPRFDILLAEFFCECQHGSPVVIRPHLHAVHESAKQKPHAAAHDRRDLWSE